jgi:uncharacterized protein (DUF1778 family)
MGRPPLAEGKAKGIVFTLRLSQDEQSALVAAAERAGKPVTQWARNVLLAAAVGAVVG